MNEPIIAKAMLLNTSAMSICSHGDHGSPVGLRFNFLLYLVFLTVPFHLLRLLLEFRPLDLTSVLRPLA